MDHGWTRVKKFSVAGWRHSSTKLFFLLVLAIVSVSVWTHTNGTANFWLLLLSMAPVICLYFPLVGFLIELLERDWQDWHLW